MAVSRITLYLEDEQYEFWAESGNSGLDLTAQRIRFGEQEEVGVGMIFPIQADGVLFGKGYYRLTQQTRPQIPGYHVPVLLREVLHWLLTEPGGIYVDGTVGGGGHAEAILQRLNAEGRLIGLDVDPEALEFAGKRLEPFGPRVLLRRANFRDLGQVLQELGIDAVDGILLDLGVSSHQIGTGYRGFSFMQKGPLDMRMNPDQKLGAYQVVNQYSEAQLLRIFREYGEERRAAAVARAIIRARERGPIDSTVRLAEIVAGAVPQGHRNKTLARIFQAVRIEVNAELTNLKLGLEAALEHLRPGGRMVVISYHSLEDRMVKQFFRRSEKRCVCPPELPQCICGEPGNLRILTRRPVRPEAEEIQENPRARSARLRAAEKIAAPP